MKSYWNFPLSRLTLFFVLFLDLVGISKWIECTWSGCSLGQTDPAVILVVLSSVHGVQLAIWVHELLVNLGRNYLKPSVQFFGYVGMWVIYSLIGLIILNETIFIGPSNLAVTDEQGYQIKARVLRKNTAYAMYKSKTNLYSELVILCKAGTSEFHRCEAREFFIPAQTFAIMDLSAGLKLSPLTKNDRHVLNQLYTKEQ